MSISSISTHTCAKLTSFFVALFKHNMQQKEITLMQNTASYFSPEFQQFKINYHHLPYNPRVNRVFVNLGREKGD
jgi:hypothetical protein